MTKDDLVSFDRCSDCGKEISEEAKMIGAVGWDTCDHCTKPFCNEHFETHQCKE